MPEEFPGSTDPERELAAIRHRYVDHLWRGAAILAIVSVPASLIRALEFGWQQFMTLQLLLAALVLSVNFLLQRLPMKIKTALLFFVFWAVGISGILSLGLLAVGIWFMAFATVMAVVLYSLRAGIVSTLLGVAVLVAAAFAFTSGVLEVVFEPSAYVRMPMAWLTYIVGYGFVLVILLLTVHYYRVALLDLMQTIQAQRDEIEQMAMHDALTGLPARKLIDDRLEMALMAARRAEQKFALLFIDLNDFKSINDSYGHDAGDAILCEIADRLADGIRAGDSVARIGGDEFLVVLAPPTDRVAAEHVARQLEKAVASSMRHGELSLRVGVSIGVAVFPDDGENADKLKIEADQAMYRNKQQIVSVARQSA